MEITRKETQRAIDDLTEALPMLPDAYRKKCTLEVNTIRLAIEAIKNYEDQCIPRKTDECPPTENEGQ